MNMYWNSKFKEKKFVWGTEESLAFYTFIFRRSKKNNN
ncbi:hypothetical protein DFR55_10868 [Herbinix hemicellulosilytica]|uniref:Uncharacterized protein n=1 Tax=Herbinix hemicellulosilytica TaxID=1564487 RepID=A0A0H5SES0_HERHM|nr:hypothetical protein DFR55_10868 [Herbinix hemicellulosilytica]CRZ33967.1 hypothetical protein HHT355_0764 [Herbinix hemicellulosilytica]